MRGSDSLRGKDAGRGAVSVPVKLGPFALVFSPLSLVLVFPCLGLGHSSCAAFAHAGSEEQSALLRHLWVFDHALPRALFLPEGVHPVYVFPITLTLRGEEVQRYLLYFVGASLNDEVRRTKLHTPVPAPSLTPPRKTLLARASLSHTVSSRQTLLRSPGCRPQ